MSDHVLVYRVDAEDRIIGVSENWCLFANANGWRGSLRPEDVMGHKLWDFIQGIETQYLYQEIFRRIRRGALSKSIPFRCDSPRERRYLELFVEALPNEGLKITSTIRRTELRDPVSLLDADTSRSMDMVTVCSMCKKLRVSPQEWTEIEEGLSRFKLFEAVRMPRLTHWLCRACYEAAMLELDDGGAPHGLDSYGGKRKLMFFRLSTSLSFPCPRPMASHPDVGAGHAAPIR